MVNPCFADKYLAYLQATQLARMGLARVLAELRGVPDVGAGAASTTFSSPASTRLKADVAGIGDGIRDAEDRIAELIAFLKTVEAKYEGLYLAAEAEREKLARESAEGKSGK